jgi:hypothetical protein
MRSFFTVLCALVLGLLAGIHRLQASNLAIQAASIDTARVYPNPWRADRHSNFQVVFDGLPQAATVRVFTVSGHEVRTLNADSSGKVSWDRRNSDGQNVASGVYLYLVTDGRGGETVGKLAIIR